MKTILVTGAGGLIGSEAVRFYCEQGCCVHGIDNNMRHYFFGEKGDVVWNIDRLAAAYETFHYHAYDIRNKEQMETLFTAVPFDLIIHAAAQPSHDWAAKEPLTDFSVNAFGTLLLLELTRQYSPEAVFVFLSTNKVYGDRPNDLPFVEYKTRYELPETHAYYNGIDESMSIDRCLHSVFGASKVSADVMVQEYGRYFGLRTCVFRGGCLSGMLHSGVELHGFLSYVVKAIVHEIPYTIYGYKGKQVRDNIHATDVLRAIDCVYHNPKPGSVYNMGGGRFSNISVCEAIDAVERITGKKANVNYSEQNRIGDHQWYISNVSAFKRDYPAWSHAVSMPMLLEQLCRFEMEQLVVAGK